MRVFFAIELSPETKEAVYNYQRGLKKVDANISWVKPENFHITLAFLGERRGEEVENLLDETKDKPFDMGAFPILISNIGFFPNGKQPRVIWVGLSKGSKEVSVLYNHLKEILRPYDSKIQENIKPHITLGRIRSKIRAEDIYQVSDSLRLNHQDMVHGFSLLESKLHPEGAVYRQLAFFRLS